jgi:molybdopterin-guanine dinucleotide biosynthesis protein A
MSASKITIAILAGGKSSRFGHDKALAPVGGIAMIHRVIAAAAAVTSNLLIVGRARPDDWPAHSPAQRFIPDLAEAHSGPVAGILAALNQAQGPVITLACDMPLVTPQLLRELIAAHRAHAHPPDATLAYTLDDSHILRAEPLLSLYTPRIAEALERILSSGRRSIQPLLQFPGVHPWQIPADLVPATLNINTPDEHAMVESALGPAKKGQEEMP